MALFFRKPVLEDDNREPTGSLIEHRIPFLIIGLLGGIVATVLSAQFEKLITTNIVLVYFIPVIVYMAGALGVQTETIYIRNLARERVNYSKYLFKEILVGATLGALFGFLIAVFAYLWLNSYTTAFAVGLAMFATMAIAPLVALVTAHLLQKEHTDPALGAGPFTTVIQDILSILIYFVVASLILAVN